VYRSWGHDVPVPLPPEASTSPAVMGAKSASLILILGALFFIFEWMTKTDDGSITQSLNIRLNAYDELTKETCEKAWAKFAGVYDIETDEYLHGARVTSEADIEDDAPEDAESKLADLYFNLTMPAEPSQARQLRSYLFGSKMPPKAKDILKKVQTMKDTDFKKTLLEMQDFIKKKYPDRANPFKGNPIERLDTNISYGNGTVTVKREFPNGTTDITLLLNHSNGTETIISTSRTHNASAAYGVSDTPATTDEETDDPAHIEL